MTKHDCRGPNASAKIAMAVRMAENGDLLLVDNVQAAALVEKAVARMCPGLTLISEVVPAGEDSFLDGLIEWGAYAK